MSETQTATEFTLKDWQKRVLEERGYLEERLYKLESFLESYKSELVSHDTEEDRDNFIQGLSYLDLQQSAMQLYKYTLDRRIELFE